MKRSGPRKDTQAPVTWEEVWWWLGEITKRWGYWPVVRITPPMPSQEGFRFIICIDLKILSIADPRLDSKMQLWRSVKNKNLTAETVALQMAVEMHRSLDNEELERERAALVQGALL